MTYHNEDTLPDLRVTIAESMEALASAIPMDMPTTYWKAKAELAEHNRLTSGARTLRWCADREASSYEEMRLDLIAAEEAREEAQGNVRDLVDNVKYAVSEWLHAEACASLLAAPIAVECSCGMAKMRQSVLDAVA